MRRWITFALVSSALLLACASNETLDFGSPDGGTPNESVLPSEDASVAPDAGVADGGTSETVASCGDGTVDPDEDCDDGNNVSKDGCSATCQLESTGATDVCPGGGITLSGSGDDPRKGSVSGTTKTTYNHDSGSCGGGSGQDAVFAVTSDVTGLLNAKLSGDYDAILYARGSCGEPNSELACDDAAGSSAGESLKVPIKKGKPVYLFVDGYSGSSGDFTLDVEVATASCGNGVAEPPEACDDSNTIAGDGCAPDCTMEGGGIVDDCPGQSIMLSGSGMTPRKVSFAGTTTSLAKAVYPSGCSGSGSNAVYSITPDVDGSLQAHLVSTYDNATLHARSECDNSSTQLDCKEATSPLEPLDLSVPVVAGLPTYVVVDSSSSSYSGPYQLDVTVAPGVCGNDVLDGSETCDDGNAANGDGCGSACSLEPVPPEADTCSGVALPLAAAAGGTYTGVVTASTETFVDDYAPNKYQNGCSTYNSGHDAVYLVTSPINGLLTATVAGSFDSMVYAQASCDGDADLGCSDEIDGNGAETISVPIEANTPTYVIVDAYSSSSSGVFELGVTVSPSVCGNGSIEGGETCDDGNAAAGDGCSASCVLEPATSADTCDNAASIALAPAAGGTYTATVVSGTTNLAHDQTFKGCSSSGRDAIYTLVPPIDGVVTVEVPVADFNVSLGAHQTCPPSTSSVTPLVCANTTSADGAEDISFSVTKGQTYYVVVDGTSSSQYGPFTMLVNLRPPGCGDALMSGGEECDDGNTTGGDGCSGTCTVEPLAGLDTCPGFTLPLAGAGTDPRTGVVTIDTSPLKANYAGTCGGSSAEGVVVVVPPIAGKLTAKLTGINYTPVLYARTTCSAAASEEDCDDDAPSFTTPSRDISISGVKAGTPYYLFVDGYNGAAGVARLNVTVTP